MVEQKLNLLDCQILVFFWNRPTNLLDRKMLFVFVRLSNQEMSQTKISNTQGMIGLSNQEMSQPKFRITHD